MEKKEETLAAIEKIEQEYEIAIEKIREKRKRLKELYSKIPNLAEKKKNNSFTVRESKIVDEYEKLIFAELSAFENRYQKMLKLKEKIENNADKPESITVKKVSSGVMPIDKISRTLFNILENDDFYSHDKVLMNVGTVKKPIETGVIIKIDELKDVQFSRQLTYFDRAVANAVGAERDEQRAHRQPLQQHLPNHTPRPLLIFRTETPRCSARYRPSPRGTALRAASAGSRAFQTAP